VDGRALEVVFPQSGARLRLAAGSPALVRLELRPGQRVRHAVSGREAVIASVSEEGRVRLVGGKKEVAFDDLWPAEGDVRLVDRLAARDLDLVSDFALRVDALHLASRREVEGLGSFLGGRIRLFAHQLHVAERASREDPVRWLLADEVGLGKTVEACLVLDRLVRTRRVERCLVIAPATLTVQWLGELWRKYHQVFVLLDPDRLKDVARDFGRDFNPFEAHHRAVIAIEDLIAEPRLTRQAVEAGVDLVVVDEAHHLRRPKGHPGDPAYRAVAPLAGLGRHLLLLTATPLEDDTHGFFRLLQLLRPDEFADEAEFEERLSRGAALPACTSSTRRVDIGGLPPRVGRPVALPPAAARPLLDLETTLRARPVADPLARRRKSELLRRAGSSGAAAASVLAPDDEAVRSLAEAADAADPRLAWLAAAAREWRAAGDKTLVFVAHMETLEHVRAGLSQRAQLATAVFHERLSPPRRDIEVARFREPAGPSLLVSTECGGEGRNFEFCDRLVLFDLPWNPVTVEQRIGRLDRIGRDRDVEVVYFVLPEGISAEVAQAYEAAGLFREPLAGLEPELASLQMALERRALGEPGAPSVEDALRSAGAARSRIQQATYRELHRDRYEPEQGEALLSRVPLDLDALNQDVVVAACERFGFAVEPHRGRRVFSIEFGNEALVDSLPGVAPGATFLGTFDRAEAVADESLDYFAAGHPLVEGVLAHLDESPIGRVAVLGLSHASERGVGLLALYREGPGFEVVAVDASGRVRPDWAAVVLRRPLRTRRVDAAEVGGAEWPATVQRLARALDPSRRPVAVAAVVFG
jgi:ATP-dependent helicase HepA